MPPGHPPPLPDNPLVVARRAEAAVAQFGVRLSSAEGKAHAAADHAAATYKVTTELSGRLDAFEGRIIGAIGRLEKKLGSRASRHDLNEVKEDVDDTKTRILIGDLKHAKSSLKYHQWILGTLGAGATIEIVRVILEHLK
jgi:hypothetical protein